MCSRFKIKVSAISCYSQLHFSENGLHSGQKIKKIKYTLKYSGMELFKLHPKWMLRKACTLILFLRLLSGVKYWAKWMPGLIRCAHAFLFCFFFNDYALKAEGHPFRKTCCNLSHDSGSPTKRNGCMISVLHLSVRSGQLGCVCC